MKPNLEYVLQIFIFEVENDLGFKSKVTLCSRCGMDLAKSRRLKYVRYKYEIILPSFCPRCGAVNSAYRYLHSNRKD